MATPRRQIVFGLDAAEWKLIERWSRAGKLPTLRRLLDQGTRGTLSSTAEFLPDTVWSSIYSGRNPATFDKYFYVQYDSNSGDLRHAKDDGFTSQPCWKILSDAGRRVGVVDAVKHPVTEGLNGFMITNWGAHATKTPSASVPNELFDEVVRKFGHNPVGDVDRISDNARSRRDMRDRLLAGIAKRKDLLCWLASERPWDVLFYGFSELHQVGHHFWHGCDPSHPRHGEIVAEGLMDSVERVYTAVDDAIGAVLDTIGDDAVVLVVSGHGMGPLRHASWNLDQILDLLGYGTHPAHRIEASHAAGDTQIWRRLKKSVPGWLQYGIKERLPQRWQDELLFRWYAGKRAWKGRRVFAVPNNDTVGALRVSVEGRDPHGMVKPGVDYDAVCEDITNAMLELTDPVSGRRIVRKVTKIHEMLRGKHIVNMPDICILWEQDFVWDRIQSPRFGTLRIQMQDLRTGSHTPHGFFVASGPNIAADRELTGHSLYDIAPTVLQTAGVALPGDLEGAPIPLTCSPGSANRTGVAAAGILHHATHRVE